MALTDNTTRAVAGAESIAVQVANSAQVYSGGFNGLRGPGHATSQGDVAAYNDEAGMLFLGPNAAPETGDGTSAKEARTQIGELILRRIAVTGAASQGDVSKLVYATDDDTLTLTRPAVGEAIGMVSEWHSGTTCDVLLFGVSARAAAASGAELVSLGSVDFAGLADGDIKTNIPFPFHGRILSLFSVTEVALVGAGGTSALHLEIGAAALTGGVLTVSTAAGATLGALLSATAITALNEIHEGDTLSVVAASTGGTLTSGSVGLFAKIQRLPGA